MKTRAALLACLLAGVPFLAACHSDKKTDDQHATKASMGAVNSKCPMRGTECPLGDKAVTTAYKGQTVAFCCKGCEGKWEKLSDAEKDQRLAAVKK